MKTIYYSIRLILLFLVLTVSTKAQTPCSGTPGSNTILPLQHTVCAGSSASMSLANSYSVSGITYQWQTSTVSIVGPYTSIPGATLSTYNSPPVNTTVYFNVIITCSNSTQSISVQHSVTVVNCAGPCNGSPGPNTVVPVSHTLCAGDVATMSLATSYSNSTGITFQWQFSGSASGPFSVIPNATLSAYTSPSLSTNMFYNVVITCTNSSLSYTATHSVSVVSCTYCAGTPGSNTVLPINQTVCIGTPASMTLANSYTASGMTYQWSSSTISPVGPFTNISGATFSVYTSGNLFSTIWYNVVITCMNNSLSISVPHTVTVVNCTVGEEELRIKNEELIIFPNPGKGIFTVESKEGIFRELIISDLSGRVVYSNHLKTGKMEINLEESPPGIYVITLVDEKGLSFYRKLFISN